MNAEMTYGGNIMAQACTYCGSLHETLCPRIKAIEYHPNGTIKRVELWGSAYQHLAKHE